MSTLFLIGQILLGAYFVQSGLMHFMKLEMMGGYAKSKNVPAAKLAVLVSGLMLLAGGLGILFQMYLVWAYGLLVAFLIVAAIMMHAFWKDTDANAKMGNMINFQKNIALASALLMLLVLQS